jgi:ankyrin repeat protein
LQVATAAELDVFHKCQLHIDRNTDGWNALHYAAATHKVKLVQQLLDIGADPAAADSSYGLTPLHLACMGRVRDRAQMAELLESRQSLYHLQVISFLVSLGIFLLYIPIIYNSLRGKDTNSGSQHWGMPRG